MRKYIILLFLLIPIASAGLSESFIGQGLFESWHDGPIKDRASATGTIEYGAEVYAGGMSSGLNVSGGRGTYSFLAGDYSIRLQEFNGSIIAESDTAGTTVDGSGKGKLEIRSYGKAKSSVRPFPIGGIASNGFFEIHSATQADPTEITSNESDNTTEFLRGLI